MLTDERLKQLMQQVGMPNSTSLMQALLQCDMEATLAERERCAAIAACERHASSAPGHESNAPLIGGDSPPHRADGYRAGTKLGD